MRKYLIGVLIGAALMFTSSVFADDIKTLIGVKVQGEFPVKINGEQLEKPAIVINGTSYLPNRAIADALGLDIKFDADLGIELKEREVILLPTPSPTPEPTSNVVVDPINIDQEYPPNIIDLKIRTLTTFIGIDKLKIEKAPADSQVESWKAELKKFEDELIIWEARKAALSN